MKLHEIVKDGVEKLHDLMKKKSKNCHACGKRVCKCHKM